MDTHKVPDSVAKYAKKVTGLDKPSAFLDELWFLGMMAHKEGITEFTEVTELSEPMEIIEPPEAKPTVNWDEYGMGYEVDDPDFTKKILPWWIEQWDSEEAAFARVKMKSENGVREPRRWVSNLYYKAMREATG